MSGVIVIHGPGEHAIAVDLSEVYQLEARKDEIPTVTKVRAPELMRAMERGYSLCGQKLAQVAAMVSKIDMSMDERRAVVMLDIAPGIIKEKGAGNNEASRQAILELDSEYKRLRNFMIEAKALQELLKVKTHAFEMSFSAIKRVYDSTSNWGMDAAASAAIRGGGAGTLPAPVPQGQVDNSFGFPIGKARV